MIGRRKVTEPRLNRWLRGQIDLGDLSRLSANGRDELTWANRVIIAIPEIADHEV